MLLKSSKNKDSFSYSDMNYEKSPPWCSSRKVCERKKLSAKSSYPVRGNMWQYLYESNDENFKCASKRRNRFTCKQETKYKGRKTKLILFMFLISGFVYALKTYKIPFIDKRSNKTFSLWNHIPEMLKTIGEWKQPSVSEECCHKMKYLSLELSRVERVLRNTLRKRSNINTKIQSTGRETNQNAIDSRYISGCVASKGADTVEWGGRVALWGIVPLWRAAPPPHIILATRRPTPADCWPFSGNAGELLIELPLSQPIRSVSVEHVRPDTAKSAPKQFIIYGVLVNSTILKLIENEYKQHGPAKQYYAIRNDGHYHSIIFKVLSNHGNAKYTCIYRVHLYGYANNVLH